MDKILIDGAPVNILLVEDNFAHAEIIMRSFKQHRVANKIFYVSDGQSALDFLNNKGEFANVEKYPTPHCVLLDLRIPKVDGLEVLKRIKSNPDLNTMPVIVLTTSSADKDIVEAYNLHVNSYVVKPLDYNKFNELLDDLGFYWVAWNKKG